ncbi:nitroreductase family protein [Vibrio sp. S4M6]|uniref:nitroreductase family protein n=1 Tax=Vibrio sinus TaxID=2946865 RepID=UPI00202A45BA|nr:nitroreductase family protein [Vibrio sinus]MCL9780772.1 nitroreductase family protein [Vibrio sinus]
MKKTEFHYNVPLSKQMIEATKAHSVPIELDTLRPAQLPNGISEDIALNTNTSDSQFTPSSLSAMQLILNRRSASALSPLPASPLSSLATTLQCALTNFSTDLIPSPNLKPQLFVLSFSVEGLAQGGYLYLQEKHALRPLFIRDLSEYKYDVLSQMNHSNACYVIFIAQPLSQWLTAYGDRGFRHAMISTGWLLDRLYLTTQSRGFTSTASGGFAASALEQDFGIDGHDLALALSFVVGNYVSPKHNERDGEQV